MATRDKAARALAQEGQRKQAWLAMADDRSAQLASVAATLHAEVDKLAKRWPTMEVSDLTLQRVNKAIRESRVLLAPDGDDFVEEIVEFVPAGDNPENRDVLLVLAELGAALHRFRNAHARDWRGF